MCPFKYRRLLALVVEKKFLFVRNTRNTLFQSCLEMII